MIDPKLLTLLRCPADGGMLSIAPQPMIDQINQSITQLENTVRDRQDQPVAEPIDGGLIDASGQWLYPIRAGIPTLIADQAIRVAGMTPSPNQRST